MSIKCQSDANLVKTHRYCKVNQLPIHPQSVPIRCKSSQSVSNPPPVRCRGPILCQSNSNLTSIQCQFCQSIVNSTSIHPNPVPIQCQSNANLMPILCQADAIASPYDANPVPIHPNLMSIQCQSSANRVQIKCSLIWISCQSVADPVPIWCQSSSSTGVNQTPIHPNPIPIRCQSDVDPMPIQC